MLTLTKSIVKYPSSVLTKLTSPVDPANLEDWNWAEDFIQEMIRACKDNNGAGLAAPQLGVSRQVIVYMDDRGLFQALVNPYITDYSKEKEFKMEGCLSLPELSINVPRSKEITVEGLQEGRKPFTMLCYGEEARRIQHEVDHLNGRLIIDYLPSLERSLFMGKWMKRMKQKARRGKF